MIENLTADDIGAAAVRIIILLFLAGSIIAMIRHRPSGTLAALGIWLLVGLVIAAGYTYRFELEQISNRILAELIPGRPAAQGTTVEIARGRGSEFQIAADINGARIAMILDTGASTVVLTQEAARSAGLQTDALNYGVTVETANGRTQAAPVTLDRLAVGSIVERSVPALIAQPGRLRSNLLGMSFLNRLQGWDVRGDKLLLRGYPAQANEAKAD
jgi:aspartyl protease family protein